MLGSIRPLLLLPTLLAVGFGLAQRVNSGDTFLLEAL